jgi:hypothetical protein
MIRLMVLGAAALALSGCAGSSRYAAPIVDMRGVDPIKYNNDLGQCTQQKRDTVFYADGGVITRCMAARGYTIIDPAG